LLLFALGNSFPKALEIVKAEQKIMNYMCVSAIATSHFHINIAKWIGEADSIKPLNRNRKWLVKEKCLSWVVSDWWNAMAQSRYEVRTDLINRTGCIEDNGKENDNSRWFPCSYVAVSTAEAAQADDMLRLDGATVSVTMTSQVAQRPPRHGIRVRPSGHLLSDLRRPHGSLMDGKPALDKARHIKWLLKWWHWVRPGFHLRAPRVSTDALQTHISELNVKPTLIASSF